MKRKHNDEVICENTHECKLSNTALTVNVGKETESSKSDLFIKCTNSLEKLKHRTICYLEASGSYCNIHLVNNKSLTIAQPLGEVMSSLPSDVFIRVHRSYVININHVNKYNRNTFYIQDQIIPIGRSYKKEALSHFNIAMKGK